MTFQPMQYIAGVRRDGAADHVTRVTNPADGTLLAEFTGANAADVNDAVSAARQARIDWGKALPSERAAVLTAAARIFDTRAAELAELESRQAGKPIRLTTEFDVPGTSDNISFFAGAARHLEGKAAAEYMPGLTSMIRREPVGVVGAIAPWNYPLQMAAWKILPAIAAGNTIVLKPSELTPLTTLLFAEILSEAGLPPGVVNVVTGRGQETGASLLAHPATDMLSFTGSTRIGRTVQQAAANGAKRLHLELGGKAPFVVFDDADIDAAIRGAVAASLINSGQDCTAATRAIVHRSVYEQFIEGVAEMYAHMRLGATDDMDTDQGPLVSEAHRVHVRGMVARANHRRVITGAAVPDLPGWFHSPTLVADVTPADEIFRDEVFGPVLTVTPFDSDEEAFALANDSIYGLAASAWTKDLARAMRASRDLVAGAVWVNDHIPIVSEMPHGGVRQSGFGKDMSSYSFDEYTVVKHVAFDHTGAAAKPWHETIFRKASHE